jgi:hypothetical protein
MKINWKTLFACAIAFALLLTAGCAAGGNPAVNTLPADDGTIAGFWLGLWHGIICPITFIISLFSKNIHFYEVHNNGSWYNAGYIIGLGISFGGCSGSAASRKKRKSAIKCE